MRFQFLWPQAVLESPGKKGTGCAPSGASLPCEEVEFNEGSNVLGWCGEPQAQVRCNEDGTLLLSGVELEAWQPVLLPRQWSDSEKEPDDEPELGVLAERVRAAMKVWSDAVRVLRIVKVGKSREAELKEGV